MIILIIINIIVEMMSTPMMILMMTMLMIQSNDHDDNADAWHISNCQYTYWTHLYCLYITIAVHSSIILCLSSFHFCLSSLLLMVTWQFNHFVFPKFLLYCFFTMVTKMTRQFNDFIFLEFSLFLFLHKNSDDDELPDTADGGNDHNWEDNDCHLFLRIYFFRFFSFCSFLLLFLRKQSSIFSFCCFPLIATCV